LDFELTEEQKALRKEWDDFYQELMKGAPEGWRGQYGAEMDSTYGNGFEEDYMDWVKHVDEVQNQRGYLNYHWPKEFGGKGIGPVEQIILTEIKTYYWLPEGNWAGLRLLAPSLMMFGTEEQKKDFLPKILSSERIFCQAWSEPNAGSDLASLTTRAVRDGDDYIVNGQKTWISSTKIANWGHSPFRTDPDAAKRHRGLSYFMYPLDTPGITVRPLYALDHRIRWGEIFFEDARIPAKYRVGEENQGWYVTMATANFERSQGSAAGTMRDIQDLIDYCKKTERNGKRLIDDPIIKEEIAELWIDCERLRSIIYRSAWEQSKGVDVTEYASAAKILWTELYHKLSNFVAHRVGDLYGQIRAGSPLALFGGVFESLWEGYIGQITNVGSNDIQHNVIANRGLKLRRE
jgi:alkylation response protein AidB-like acyl-CoA dehydrogenase